MRTIPFLVSESTMALYPADATGQSVAGEAIWMGASTERLGLREVMSWDDVTGSGAAYRSTRPIPQGHEIQIDRLWALRNDALTDYRPQSQGAYVLFITWEDAITQAWYRRTYVDVRCGPVALESDGIMQSLMSQQFHAGHVLESSGYGAYSPTPSVGTEESCFFSHLSAMAANQYFLGHYQFTSAKTLTSATAIAHASAGDATVLTLEVDGVLTDKIITLASGSLGDEVTGSVDLADYAVSANVPVRWKITSAPASAGNQGDTAAVVMRVG